MDLNPLISTEVGNLLNKHNLFFPLIKAELIEDKIKNISIKSDEILEELEKIKSQNSIKNNDEFEEWKVKNRIKSDSLNEQIEKALKLKKYTDETFSKKAEARFLDRQLELDKVTYSLIRIRDPFKAKELYFRINDGEAKFEDIAKEFSEGIEKTTRGIIGPVSLAKSHPQLITILRSLKPGELSKPIMIDKWSLIIRLEEMNKAKLDSSTRSLMVQELFEISINEEARIIIKQFLENVA